MMSALGRRAALASLAAFLACGVSVAIAQRSDGERVPPDIAPGPAPFNSRAVDDLIGEPVLAADGQAVGAIVDLVADRGNQFFAVIGVERSRSLGARNVLISMQDIQVSVDRVTLNPAKSLQLPAMPDYVGGGFKSIVPYKNPHNRG
jgi:hypothetical protein